MRVGSSHHDIASNGGVNDLGGDILVGETHNKAVLGCVVLVLVLGSEPQPGPVIGLPL
jgi:hypothetical protein